MRKYLMIKIIMIVGIVICMSGISYAKKPIDPTVFTEEENGDWLVLQEALVSSSVGVDPEDEEDCAEFMSKLLAAGLVVVETNVVSRVVRFENPAQIAIIKPVGYTIAFHLQSNLSANPHAGAAIVICQKMLSDGFPE